MAILPIFTLVFLFMIRSRFPKSKPLSEIIRNRYGNYALKFIRKVEKLDFSLRKISVDIEFLNSWKWFVSNFLCYKIPLKWLQNFESHNRLQRIFLQGKITFETVEKEKIIMEIQKIQDDLRPVISFIDWIHISNKFIESNKRIIKQVEGVQNYKLLELMGGTLLHDPEKVIHNFSSYILLEPETSLLIKGLNFSLPPKKLKLRTIFFHLSCCSGMFCRMMTIEMNFFMWKVKLKILVYCPLDYTIRKVIGLKICLRKTMKLL